ncbi:hypothetical protein [Agaribacter marinus]|uniref:Uncharacterized protein n=1 Tax=Agaribacter marinus TaxID=1431249 RepID=A0AA37SVG1_9ALTE|nr:hypothetical protein [Agaribacter marinus]GLR69862.1 hypothetical protein GCM10007852_07700 [Agaribacter marinus]
MPLKKTYTIAETQAAIDRADNANINQMRMVRNDISNQHFSQKNIKPKHRDKSLPQDLQYPGAKDVGHVFRHVNGTHEAGKSIYKDKQTAILATRAVLNATEGQQALQALENELTTRTTYDNMTKRVRVDVSAGNHYGSDDNGKTWKKVIIAQCELLSLGETLWVHSSYPRTLQT